MTPMKFTPPAGRRGGFTLVELLVAAGLSVLVMAILATAFQQGMETLSHLKSTVTLSQQLRGVEGVIRGDLSAAHLEDGETGDTVLVSNEAKIGAGWRAPNKGYFRVEIPTPLTPSSPDYEGTDEGGDSYRATNQSLRFTARLGGGSPQEVVRSEATGLAQLLAVSKKNMVATSEQNTVFAGVWMEVRYFLEPTGLTSSNMDGSSGLALYTLRRRVRALAPYNSGQVGVTAANYPELSVDPAGGVNTPSSVTNPANRPAMDSIPPASALYGSDVLLSNVVSMQVQVMLDPTPPAYAAATYLDNPRETTTDTSAWVYDTAVPPVDTLTTPAIPPGGTPRRYGLKAIQIKLRVYDVRNRVTRQVTIAQDL